jgi:hypothetical protein
MTPTSLTLAALRKRSWPCQVVEKWVDMGGAERRSRETAIRAAIEVVSGLAFVEECGMGWCVEDELLKLLPPLKSTAPPGIRRDLFGCIDIVALDGLPGVLGIQATSLSNRAARVAKIRTDPEVAPLARAWLLAGNRLEVWGWAKVEGRWAASSLAIQDEPELAPTLPVRAKRRRRRTPPELPFGDGQ